MIFMIFRMSIWHFPRHFPDISPVFPWHFGAQGPGGTAQAAALSLGWGAGAAAEAAAAVPPLETAPGNFENFGSQFLIFKKKKMFKHMLVEKNGEVG